MILPDGYSDVPAGKIDVQGVVDQAVARHAEELKQKLEEQQKQLQKELDKTKAGKTETANAAAANPSGAVGGGTTKPSPASPGGGEEAASRVQPRPATRAQLIKDTHHLLFGIQVAVSPMA